jgi:hypothetical protein
MYNRGFGLSSLIIFRFPHVSNSTDLLEVGNFTEHRDSNVYLPNSLFSACTKFHGTRV